jgi:hypothetical protein
MKKFTLFTSMILFTVLAAGTGLAKDKKKDKDNDDRDHDHDRDRHEERGDYHDRSRSIYVIERDRPVERVVFIDRDGRYYRVVDGRRTYVRDRYFESYPSKYYYPDGRRRVTITLPF